MRIQAGSNFRKRQVENYATWLAETDIPKLFINADPGSILVGRQRELCRAWPNQTEVTVKGPRRAISRMEE